MLCGLETGPQIVGQSSRVILANCTRYALHKRCCFDFCRELLIEKKMRKAELLLNDPWSQLSIPVLLIGGLVGDADTGRIRVQIVE